MLPLTEKAIEQALSPPPSSLQFTTPLTTRFPSLTVTILDQDNRVIFPANGVAPAAFVDERTFPLAFFDPGVARLELFDEQGVVGFVQRELFGQFHDVE